MCNTQIRGDTAIKWHGRARGGRKKQEGERKGMEVKGKERVGALRKVAGGEEHKLGGYLPCACACRTSKRFGSVASTDLRSSPLRRHFYFLSSFVDRDVTRCDVINLTIDFIPDLPLSICATDDDDKGRSPAARFFPCQRRSHLNIEVRDDMAPVR